MSRYFLNNLWRWKCGLPEQEPPAPKNIESLRKTEWSNKFEKLMRNRMVMGAFRYGTIEENRKKKNDRMLSVLERLSSYELCGNTENLIDIANLCMLEFMDSKHPNAHFESKDDDIHVKYNL